MQKKSGEFINIQKMIRWQLDNKASLAEDSMPGNPITLMSSYDLVEFLRSQIKRADHAISKLEMQSDEIARIAKAKF